MFSNKNNPMEHSFPDVIPYSFGSRAGKQRSTPKSEFDSNRSNRNKHLADKYAKTK